MACKHVWKEIARQCLRKYERLVDLIAIEKDKKSKEYVDYKRGYYVRKQ